MHLRSIFSLITLFTTIIWGNCFAKSPPYTSIVMDAHTGEIFQTHKADLPVYPASLTKIMTLYLIFEALEKHTLHINQKLKVSKRASRQMPSKLYLKPGDSISVKDAILALMTKSANDVAVVVAEAIGGSEERFSKMMTNKARQLGMKNTTFRNASGLQNKRQKSSARDMALLSQAMYHHYPRYYRYFSTRVFKFRGKKYGNHNKLLGKVKGVDGLKTGFLNAAGWNLAASATRQGHRLIAVVMGGKTNRWRNKRVTRLLEDGFKILSQRQKYTFYPQRKPSLVYAPENKPRNILNHPSDWTVPVKGPDNFKNLPSQNTTLSIKTLPAIHHAHIFYPKQKPVFIKPSRKPQTLGVSRKKSSPNSKWAIQVGAFNVSGLAHKAASSRQKLIPFLKNAIISVNRVKNNRNSIYRARIIGLNKANAYKACTHLKNLGMDCLPLLSK